MLARVLQRFGTISLLCGFATSVFACDVEDQGDPGDLVEDELREDAIDDARRDQPTELTQSGEYAGFDVERQLDLYDADGDSFPDITEQIGGTDLLDPGSHPGPDANFPAVVCR